MLNYKGITLVETLLTLVILFTIASTLIPLSYRMYSTLYNKQLELYASETAYEAAKVILHENHFSGVNTIDHNQFNWDYDGEKICVEFKNLNGERKKCISQIGEIE
ncbi:hypothetical protein [Lysinibacillus antri]|uniref:Type II secretion system protein n=1 Tax=Lysinibacillus antri TaxID=2498145 RepID=A0A3S0QS54_9BACI|nr:hypothetical protein [Lysinibacillus antri]RUL56959.1 hypothetical protein EK386_00625 [Lysinibacillus antri]